MNGFNENNNQDIESMLLSFMDDINKYKDELSVLEKEYESLLNDQEKGSKKINYLTDVIVNQKST